MNVRRVALLSSGGGLGAQYSLYAVVDGQRVLVASGALVGGSDSVTVLVGIADLGFCTSWSYEGVSTSLKLVEVPTDGRAMLMGFSAGAH